MKRIRISGYTVSFNCITHDSPLVPSIRSMLGFCDEVVVVDAGSSDGTIDLLHEIARTDPRLRVVREFVDFSHPRWGIHLMTSLKARARLLCQGEYVWEMDADEVVGPQEYEKIERLLSTLQLSEGAVTSLTLPTAHFWGDISILRTDIPVWRPRLSKNDPRITHGLPFKRSKKDELGNVYLELLSDPATECHSSYAWVDLESDLPNTVPSNYSLNESLRITSLAEYFKALAELPVVLNVGTLNLARSLRLCTSFLPGYYSSIFCDHNFDSTEWNPLFKKPWMIVTDEEVSHAAARLKEGAPVQFIRNSTYSQELVSLTTHQIQIPLSIKDWIRESREREWGISSAPIYEEIKKESSNNPPSPTATLATEFSTLARDFTEVHDLEVELPYHQSSGRSDERVPIIHRTIPIDKEGLIDLAHRAFEEGHLEEGRRFLSYAENIAPKDATILMMRIDYLLSVNETQEAIVYAKRGLWLFPTRSEFRKAYQECIAQRGHND